MPLAEVDFDPTEDRKDRKAPAGPGFKLVAVDGDPSKPPDTAKKPGSGFLAEAGKRIVDLGQTGPKRSIVGAIADEMVHPLKAMKHETSAINSVVALPVDAAAAAAGKATSLLPHAPDTPDAHLGPITIPGHKYDPRWGAAAVKTALMALPAEDAELVAASQARRENALAEAAKKAGDPNRPPVNGLAQRLNRTEAADPEHIAAVERLRKAGVKPAAHQADGGAYARIAEAAKSNPYLGEGVRAAEQTAQESFNRGIYNKVLEPLGESVNDKFPVGRKGVNAIEKRLNSEYEKVLPHVRVVADQGFTDQLAEIRTAADKLGEPQAKQFEQILNQDVLHKVGPSGMDGKTFKAVESDLLRQARGLKGSPDPNQRGLGRLLDDVTDALRQDMIDHSPAQYKAKLEGLNASWARFTRLQDAAARKQGGRGIIAPGDLLASVKKGDATVRKGAFARGDALLQDFAEDADLVLSPKVKDSGTAERQMANRLLSGHSVIAGAIGAMGGGPLGAVAGIGADLALAKGTNFLADRVLSASPARDRAAQALSRVQQQNAGRQLAKQNVLAQTARPALAGAAAPPPINPADTGRPQ